MSDAGHDERLGDPGRLEALRRTGLLDSPGDEAFDLLTRLASRLIGAPIALVSLVADDRQFFKAGVGLDEPWASRRGTPMSHSFCQYVVTSEEPLVVSDAREHDRLKGNAAVSDLGVVSYAGVPLEAEDGHVVGSFCVMDHRPREWSSEELATLRDLSRLVVAQIRLAEQTERQAATLEELDRSRERFQAIFRDAGIGITVVSTDAEALGRYENANPTFTRLVGYGVEELRERSFLDITHPDHRDADRAALEEMLRGERQVLREDKRYIRKDGSVVWVRIAMTVIRDADGEPDSALTMVEDITHRREVDRMKDEFISVVSHELRTPLTSIRGSLGLLAGGMLGPLPERGQRMLELATKNTDRLVRLINDMLDIERIESGRVEIRLRDVAAGGVMTQSAESIRRMAEEHGVRVEVEAVHATVRADPDRLEQVFTNLISNAIKFSPSGETVRVGGEAMSGVVRFHVTDRGRGVPADKLEAIFGRFQQVDASDSREKGGTGLGLAICRSILDQMGGRIWAESEPGVGSTFHFELPAAGESLGEGVRAPAGTERTAVLGAGEDQQAAAAVRRALAQLGFRMVWARTPAELRRAAAARPAVIVLDMEAAGVGGWNAVVELKSARESRGIPLVLLGTLGSSEARGNRSLEWLTKPLDEESLTRRLQVLLGGGESPSTVLVVEDDLDLAQVLVAVFEGRGIRAMRAGTGSEAIERCEAEPPDLVVLDLMLPDGDGGQVVDWLRRNDRLREVPLVVYSARDVGEEEAARLGVGREDLLNKGRTAPEALAERVANVLEQVVREGGGR